jgi:hypothetical protein
MGDLKPHSGGEIIPMQAGRTNIKQQRRRGPPGPVPPQ